MQTECFAEPCLERWNAVEEWLTGALRALGAGLRLVQVHEQRVQVQRVRQDVVSARSTGMESGVQSLAWWQQ